jgi:tetratricopeptide (TPR) repeat protein
VDPLVAALLLGVLAGLPVLVDAHEAQASSSSPEDAMRRFEQAERLYERGDYDGAIEVLRGLLDENDDPVLWYNLGRAYEGADEATAAIEAYERYLEGSPNAPDRDDVRERVSRLGAEDPEEAPAVPVPVPRPEPVAPSPIDAGSRPRVPLFVPWLVFGAGGAGVATGGVFGVLARRSERDAADAFIQVEARDVHDRARRQALAANVSFAVGGVVAAAGLTWAIVATVTRRHTSARVQPHGLGIAGRF